MNSKEKVENGALLLQESFDAIRRYHEVMGRLLHSKRLSGFVLRSNR